MGGGSDSPEYTSSKEQKQLYSSLVQPAASLAAAALPRFNYDITGGNLTSDEQKQIYKWYGRDPSAWPTSLKTAMGVTETLEPGRADTLWNIPGREWTQYAINQGYAIPSIPQYENLSPETQRGLWQPYEAGFNQLRESLQGSAGAGYGISELNKYSKLYDTAAGNVAMNAYQMQMPAWQATVQQNQAKWTSTLGLLDERYQAEMQRNQYPYQLGASLVGATMPQAYYQESTNPAGAAAAGAASGALAGASFGPWGAAIGGVVGGAAGYFGA